MNRNRTSSAKSVAMAFCNLNISSARSVCCCCDSNCMRNCCVWRPDNQTTRQPSTVKVLSESNNQTTRLFLPPPCEGLGHCHQRQRRFAPESQLLRVYRAYDEQLPARVRADQWECPHSRPSRRSTAQCGPCNQTAQTINATRQPDNQTTRRIKWRFLTSERGCRERWCQTALVTSRFASAARQFCPTALGAHAKAIQTPRDDPAQISAGNAPHIASTFLTETVTVTKQTCKCSICCCCSTVSFSSSFNRSVCFRKSLPLKPPVTPDLVKNGAEQKSVNRCSSER